MPEATGQGNENGSKTSKSATEIVKTSQIREPTSEAADRVANTHLEVPEKKLLRKVKRIPVTSNVERKFGHNGPESESPKKSLSFPLPDDQSTPSYSKLFTNNHPQGCSSNIFNSLSNTFDSARNTNAGAPGRDRGFRHRGKVPAQSFFIAFRFANLMS